MKTEINITGMVTRQGKRDNGKANNNVHNIPPKQIPRLLKLPRNREPIKYKPRNCRKHTSRRGEPAFKDSFIPLLPNFPIDYHRKIGPNGIRKTNQVTAPPTQDKIPEREWKGPRHLKLTEKEMTNLMSNWTMNEKMFHHLFLAKAHHTPIS